MGVQKCINGLLLIYFLFMVIVTPLIDVGHILTWYATNKIGDATSSNKIPHFAVVFILFEHLLVWPLCIANFYGIFKAKSWVKKTCLIYGVGATTAMAAILSEIIRSSGASSALSSIYVPFLGFALISTLNGLVPHH
ncbi:hypothetical protein C5167_036998 [Papaver somniferum]|uniref:EXPERA domain-containing protein n=1 Tax=Papaver somniferum TaxID=3469 RepID=A0A4Y7I981_PAPSO|nr:uncharacterized protein LOC113327583 [Papaver somniferum]RZC44048.1 hypothetical protein C5167_036998 [Papaver somniferum]